MMPCLLQMRVKLLQENAGAGDEGRLRLNRLDDDRRNLFRANSRFKICSSSSSIISPPQVPWVCPSAQR